MSALHYAEIGSSNINYNSPLPLPLIFYHACITGGVLAARHRLNRHEIRGMCLKVLCNLSPADLENTGKTEIWKRKNAKILGNSVLLFGGKKKNVETDVRKYFFSFKHNRHISTSGEVIKKHNGSLHWPLLMFTVCSHTDAHINVRVHQHKGFLFWC